MRILAKERNAEDWIFRSSLMLVGFILWLLFGEIPASVFLVVYPLLAYGFFLMKAQRFNGQRSSRGVKWLAIGIGVTAVLVLGLLLRGLSNNEIVVQQDKIQIEGMYGQMILMANIDSLVILKQLPQLSTRTNGFALGNEKKGYFKTKRGDKVLIYIADARKPCLLFGSKTRVGYTIIQPLNLWMNCLQP